MFSRAQIISFRYITGAFLLGKCPEPRSRIGVLYERLLDILVALDSQFDEYMAKAEDAQQQAERAKDPKAEEAWRRIAANYRNLAVMAQYADRKRRPDS